MGFQRSIAPLIGFVLVISAGRAMVASDTPHMQSVTRSYWRIVSRDAQGSMAGQALSPPPLCTISGWMFTSADPWSACQSSQQRTRNELWTRTLLAGSGCGPLSETRVAMQACTPPPSTPPPPPSMYAALLGKSDLVYEGAFRVPLGSGTASYSYGGTALTYHPGHNSLLLVGNDWYQRVGEISIPAPGLGATLSTLQRATALQPPTDVLAGKLKSIDGDTWNGVKVGGLLLVGNSMVVTAWSYYDAGTRKQTKSHFVTGQNFSALGTVTGPFQVGIGFQNIVPKDTTRIGGFVSGYMSTIPNAWQAALGGTHLTGQGSGIPIVTRTSSGPSATVFRPSELGVPNSPTKLVMGYPNNLANPGSALDHATLGIWGGGSGLYNGTQFFRGMVFPEGTRSILFFGWGGSTFCYGAGTADPSLHGQPHPQGGVWCYDPVNFGRGTHGYPMTSIVWAYDVNDFIAVKQGTKKPWEVVPYDTWTFQLPFQSRKVGGVELGIPSIVGAAYDAAGKRIFVAAYRNDRALPLIHVFRLP